MTYDTKQQTRPYASEAVSEIALDALNASDCIVIKTANSTYCFVVTDPVKRRGILMGGALGSGKATTVLLGAEIRNDGQVSALLSKLHEGSQAVFFVASSDGVNQLITAPITGLVRTRAKTTHRSESPIHVSGVTTAPQLTYPDGAMWESQIKQVPISCNNEGLENET